MATDGKTQAPFRIVTEKQATELKVVITPGAGTGEALELNISQEVGRLKLAAPIDIEALRGACQAAARGEKAEAVIAKGVMPEAGVDARLIWSKKITGAGEQGGKFSHYSGRIERRVVKKGDPLAKLVGETPGADGRDIYGKVLKAPKGKSLKIKAGANASEKEGIFFAEKEGMVRVDNGKVVVDEIYLVENGVNFDVGNIDFPGSVIVKGGILDLFEIKAGGSVQVEGLVEAAKITSESDVEIKGGVEGKKKGLIVCRGNFSAKFLVNAEVRSEKDVCVETQIITSKVEALGAVKAPQGAIAGGEVSGLGGVDVGTLGSESGAATTVTAGINPGLSRMLAEIDAEMAEGKKKLAAMDKEIDAAKGRQLTPAMRERLTEVQMLKIDVSEKLAADEKKRNDLVTQTHEAARPVILVRKAIHPGVSLRLGNLKMDIHETLQGPLKVVPDVEHSILRFVPVTL
jgi:hypothetical protein